MLDDQFAIIDNAKIHKTQAGLTVLEQAFHGRFYFCSKYSPDFKPIENGFKDIKAWLRDREYQAMSDPMLWINRAFHYFSILSEGGRRGTVYTFSAHISHHFSDSLMFFFSISSFQLLEIVRA